MRKQQEANNMLPAVPVNLQMWPSAPQEKKGKERTREGGKKKTRRKGMAEPGSKHRLIAVGITLLLFWPNKLTYKNQEGKSDWRRKNLFSPGLAYKEKEKEKSLANAFILEHSIFHLWGYDWLHCRLVWWGGGGKFPHNFNLQLGFCCCCLSWGFF